MKYLKLLSIFLIATLSIGLLCSYFFKNDTKIINATTNEMSDTEYIDKYIRNLDIALIGENELIFDDSTEIPSNTLYKFFIYATCNDELYEPEQWFNENDKRYHIPLRVVSKTLNKYFNKLNFNPEEVYCYDTKNEEFIDEMFDGFGGARFIKLRKKEFLDNNILSITSDFYDENFEIKDYTKIYKIELGKNYYKYLSIEKYL